MGESYVWPQAVSKLMMKNASKLMQKSAMMAVPRAFFVLPEAPISHLGGTGNAVLPRLRKRLRRFSVRLSVAMLSAATWSAMVFFWGDYLRVEPDYAKAIQSTKATITHGPGR